MNICGYPIWVVLLIGLGVFTAAFIDSIGGGGGIISVPVYLLAGLPAHYALGTNKMSSCIGTAVSSARYLFGHFVKLKLAVPAVAAALLGASLGTRLQLIADEMYLKYMLLLVLPVVAVVMLRQKKLPETPGEIAPGKQLAIVTVSALVIGTYDGFYGPGTGTFLILAFTTVLGFDLKRACGNTKIVNLTTNVSALIVFMLAGQVYYAVAVPAMFFSILGNWVGSGLAIKKGAKFVRPVMIFVLCLLLVKIVYDFFTTAL